ncbi:hypothetical protein M0R45_002291 [Rubus argutus]|uniref:Uncharacterized protein n=1 Tax=Rubus argutus TaxID=59490 RepID=A0AAW1VIZ7_RUBAR
MTPSMGEMLSRSGLGMGSAEKTSRGQMRGGAEINADTGRLGASVMTASASLGLNSVGLRTETESSRRQE